MVRPLPWPGPVVPPGWATPPRTAAPVVIGTCPASFVGEDGAVEVCGRPIHALVGSPWNRPGLGLRAHVVAAVPCLHWLDVDTANKVENGAWS